MRSKGYTSLDIIIIVVVLAISAIITIPKVSMALKDNREELYENQINLYLNQANKYGEDHKKDFDDDNNLIITIDDLISEGYVLALESEKIYDIRDNTTELNKLKIKITYDEDKDNITSKLM